MKFDFVISGNFAFSLTQRISLPKEFNCGVSGNQDLFVVCSGDEILIYRYDGETKSFKVAQTIIHEKVSDVRLLPSRNEVVSVCSDRRMKIFKVSDGSLTKDFEVIHKDQILSLSVSIQGRKIRLLTTSLDLSVKVHTVKNMRCLAVLKHPNIVWRALEMPNSDIVCACEDSNLYVWRNKKIVHTLGYHEYGVKGVDFVRSDGNTIDGIVTSGHDGHLNFYDLEYQRKKKVFAHRDVIFSVRSMYNFLITSSEDESAHLWTFSEKTDSYQLVKIFQQAECVKEAIILPSTLDIIVCADSGQIYIYSPSKIMKNRYNEQLSTEATKTLDRELLIKKQKSVARKLSQYQKFDNMESVKKYLPKEGRRIGDLEIIRIEEILHVFQFDESKNWAFLCYFSDTLQKDFFLRIMNADEGYESPDDDINLIEDDHENETLKFIQKLNHDTIHEEHDTSHSRYFRVCNSCHKILQYDKKTPFYHCFECTEKVDLCKRCYESQSGGKVDEEENKNKFHLHQGTNFFHVVTIPRFKIWESISKSTTLTTTCAQTMMKCFSFYSDRYFMGYRRSVAETYRWITYSQVEKQMIHLANGMNNLGIQEGEYVGMLCSPCLEFVVIDFACLYSNLVSVPIQRILSPYKVKGILKRTKISCLFVSHEFQESIMEMIYSDEDEELKNLKLVVLFKQNEIFEKSEEEVEGEEVEDEEEEKDQSTEVLHIRDLNELIRLGKKREDMVPDHHPNYRDSQGRERIISLIHTSGSTTSIPKGVVFRESRWIDNFQKESKKIPFVLVLYSPLSHSNGRKKMMITFSNGGRLGFLTNGQITNFFEDCRALRPSRMSLIPRICNFVYHQFQEEVAKEIEKKRSSDPERMKEIKTRVFRKFQDKKVFGDRITKLAIGGAKCSMKVKRFFRKLLNIPVYDTYGATEVGIISYNNKFDPSRHKLENVPSLGYFGTDRPFPRGELLLKVEKRFVEYYSRSSRSTAKKSLGSKAGRKEKETSTWYHTGDIVEIRKGDKLVVIDRKSNIVKMANGEFISFEGIENAVVSKSTMIDQMCVHTNTHDLVALVVLQDHIIIIMEGEEKSVSKGNIEALVLKEINGILKRSKFNSWEVPSKIKIIKERFTPENKQLTITMKKSRKNIEKRYKSELDELYKDSQEEKSVSIESIIISRILDVQQLSKDDKQGENLRKMTLSELGGDSLTILRVMNEFRSRRLPVPSLEDLNKKTVLEISNLLKKERGRDEEEVEGEEGEEAELDSIPNFDDLKKEIMELVTSYSRNTNEQPSNNIRNIFLTGSTGFLGMYILRDLLESFHPSVKIHVLIRPKSVEEFKKKMGLSPFDPSDEGRVVVIEGDLGLPYLGMDGGEARFSALSFDLIIHCGAFVNHFFPYRDLYAANVLSAKYIYQLSRGKVPILFVSSSSVYDKSYRESTFENFDLEKSRSHTQRRGYATSKWVADILFSKYIPNSIVFRPRLIFGTTDLYHSQQASTSLPISNKKDWLNIILKTILRHRIGPDHTSTRNHLSLVPVNYVSHVIVEIASKYREESLGHVFDLDVKNVSVGNIIQEIGGEIQLLPFNRWLMEVGEREGEKSEFFPFLQRLKNKKMIGSVYRKIRSVDTEADDLIKNKVWKNSTRFRDGNGLIYTKDNLRFILEYLQDRL